MNSSRKLSGVSNGKSIQYQYDHTGNRVKNVVDGVTTEFRMAGRLLLSEKRADDTLQFHYDTNANIFSTLIDGTRYLYLKNIQNDVIGLIDVNGNQVVEYKYDSWGNTVSITGTLASTVGVKNPFRYRGYYLDAETGLYYVGSRYYDPGIGRFISLDTFNVLVAVPMALRDKNLYVYCNNNPVIYRDVTGAIAETVFDIASLAWSAVEVTMNPTDLSAWINLLGDTVDLVPFVTGVGETIKALRASSKIADGTDEAIDTYRNLRKINKGTGKEVHHIIEKRFAKSIGMGNYSEMLSVSLDKRTHRQYTNAWRQALKYGKKYSEEEVIRAAASVYSKNPRLMGCVIFSLVK